MDRKLFCPDFCPEIPFRDRNLVRVDFCPDFCPCMPREHINHLNISPESQVIFRPNSGDFINRLSKLR